MECVKVVDCRQREKMNADANGEHVPFVMYGIVGFMMIKVILFVITAISQMTPNLENGRI
jgi:hypothetical protein